MHEFNQRLPGVAVGHMNRLIMRGTHDAMMILIDTQRWADHLEMLASDHAKAFANRQIEDVKSAAQLVLEAEERDRLAI